MSGRTVHPDLFDADRRRPPEAFLAEAMSYGPSQVFACFSSGDDSLASTAWIMENVPGAKVFNANTGIGFEQSRQFVRDTCAKRGWPLIEIRAKEDCGQDYDEIVRSYGFPGPAAHRFMYARLKERCIDKLVREHKKHRHDRIVLATGIRHDESIRRMGYSEDVVRRDGATVWMNHIYWWSDKERDAYRIKQGLSRNPVKEKIGISGECLCGAFSHKGEKALIRVIEPELADRIESLEREARARGFCWGYEDEPPPPKTDLGAPLFDLLRPAKPSPFCRGCEKTA